MIEPYTHTRPNKPHLIFRCHEAPQAPPRIQHSCEKRSVLIVFKQKYAFKIIRQVNGVKLEDILFYLRFRLSVCAHSYLDANISKMV